MVETGCTCTPSYIEGHAYHRTGCPQLYIQPPDTVRATHVSRPVAAPEWCLRQGMSVAARYFADDPGKRLALAADVAEVIHAAAEAGKSGALGK